MLVNIIIIICNGLGYLRAQEIDHHQVIRKMWKNQHTQLKLYISIRIFKFVNFSLII